MQKFVAALAVVLIALVLWLATRDGSGADAVSPSPARDDSGSSALAASTSGSELAHVPEPQARQTAPTTAVVADAPVAVVEPVLAEIRGRFLLQGGAPAVGVALSVNGWTANQERVMAHGVPEKWPQPTGTSGSDGRFALRFDPPRAFQFVLEGELAGHAAASWRWSEIEPASVVDVGDVTLQPAGSVRARVVDATGRVLVDGWRIYADGGASAQVGDREATSVSAQVDPATGWAVLDGLPPGTAVLKAYSRIANWIDGPAVRVGAGETVDADIAYTGPDNSRRIVVSTSTRPFHVYSGDVTDITLSGTGGAPRSATKIAGSSQSFAFDDLEPGSYSVQVDDPRFLPWREDGVRPGVRIDAKLRGNAAVRLTVVDAKTGAPVDRYDVDVRFDGVNFRPNVVRVLERKNEPPAGGTFDGLVPVDTTVIVRADGYAPLELPVPKLAPNETRVLSAALTSGATISGVVRASDGGSVHADVALVLYPQRDGKDRAFQRNKTDERTTRSDATGRYSFEVVGDGAWAVEALVSAAVIVTRNIDVVGGADVDAPIEVPATGFVAGRVTGPDGADWTGIAVLVTPKQTGQRWIDTEKLRAPIAADGSFKTPLVATGLVDVSLSLPMVRVPSGMNSWHGGEGGRVPLESFELTPGANAREYDVRAHFPGAIAVTVRVDGAGAANFVVQAHVVEQDGRSGAAVLDADGRGLVAPLLPGSYRITVRPIEGGWQHAHPSLVEVAAGTRPALEIDVRLAEGSLLVVDEKGAPIADTAFVVGRAGADWPDVDARTDRDGRARLRMPLGAYELWSGRPPFDVVRGPSFVWTPHGPVPESVVVARER